MHSTPPFHTITPLPPSMSSHLSPTPTPLPYHSPIDHCYLIDRACFAVPHSPTIIATLYPMRSIAVATALVICGAVVAFVIRDVIELYKKIVHEWDYLLEPEEKEDITKASYISIRLYMEGFDIPKIHITPNESQAKDNSAQITVEDHAKEDIVECEKHEVKPENGLKTSQEYIEHHDSKSIDMHLDNERYEDQPLIQRVKSKNKKNAQATVNKIQKEEMTKLTTKQEVRYKTKAKKDMPLEKFADPQTTAFQSKRKKVYKVNPIISSRGSEIEWKIPWSQDIRFDQMVAAYKDDANGVFKFIRDEYDTPLPNLYDVLLNALGLSTQFVLPGQSVHPSLYIEATWSCWECLEWLILAIALQLVAIAYGVNSFSEPLEDLESCMVKLLECLRNPRYRLGIVPGCSWFVADGAPLL
eukprot:Gb_41231 [translate_table: standard]